MTEHQKKTLALADAYFDACRDQPDLWRAVVSTPAMSERRTAAIRAHTQGRERCEAARKALLEHVARGNNETGAK